MYQVLLQEMILPMSTWIRTMKLQPMRTLKLLLLIMVTMRMFPRRTTSFKLVMSMTTIQFPILTGNSSMTTFQLLRWNKVMFQNINKQTSLFLRRMQMLTNLFPKRMKIQTSLYLLLTSLRPEKNQAMTITRSRT